MCVHIGFVWTVFLRNLVGALRVHRTVKTTALGSLGEGELAPTSFVGCWCLSQFPAFFTALPPGGQSTVPHSHVLWFTVAAPLINVTHVFSAALVGSFFSLRKSPDVFSASEMPSTLPQLGPGPWAVAGGLFWGGCLPGSRSDHSKAHSGRR